MKKTISIFLPPLPQLSGGMLVLLQLGNHLSALGHNVNFVIHDGEANYMGYSDVHERTTVPIVSWSQMSLTAQHVWIVPDGWTNAIVMGVRAGARCIMYFQSWTFSLRSLPENVFWKDLPVEFVYVSDPVRNFVREITGKDGPILQPGIDLDLFYPKSQDLQEEQRANDVVRIAWMPRKNKIFGEQIEDALLQRMKLLHPHIRVQFVPIQRVLHEEVPKILRTCHIFLATGFPEGFALPPLEAMASGCIPVGFSGFGGWDYMRQFHIPGVAMPYLAKPWLELPEKPFGGNGFYVEDAHILAATYALEQATLLVYKNDDALQTLYANMAATAEHYSTKNQQKNIETLTNYLMS